MTTVIRSKLGPPVSPSFAIRRPRLERLVEGSPAERLTLVAAPAGFGKSVLLSAWAADRPAGDVAWMTVDERDRNPDRFGHHLLASLMTVRPGSGRHASEAVLLPGAGLGDEFVDLLLADLEELDRPLSWVVEDTDFIEGSPVMAGLARLIGDAPDHIRFVIACRADPSVGLHRLRVQGRLREIRANDLRFLADEVARVVTALSGQPLTDDEIAYVHHVTEGWPVAVQLAGLSLRGVDRPEVVTRFGGSDRTVVDYLSAELLAREPETIRGFLQGIAILGQFNGALAEAVTGRRDAAELLADLDRRSFLVTPIGGEPGWFRLHRLVRQFLVHDLSSADPQRPAELHGRAADWWLAHDDIDQAAAHLVQARDWTRLRELVLLYGRSYWDMGLARTVESWIEAMPDALRRDDVELRLNEAAIHLITGRLVLAGEQLAHLERHHTLTAGVLVNADAVRSGMIELGGEPQAVVAAAERGLATVAGLQPEEMPNLLNASGPEQVPTFFRAMAARAHLLLGHGAAFPLARDSLRTTDATPAVFRVQAMATMALLQVFCGQLDEATQHIGHADALAASHLRDGHPSAAPSFIVKAITARLRGDLDAARALTDEGLTVAMRWQRWSWVGLLMCEQATIELVAGAIDAALSVLDRRHTLGAPPPGPLVQGLARAVRLRADALTDGPTSAMRRLDPRTVGMSWPLTSAAVSVALQAGEAARARKYLDAWPAAAQPLGELERMVLTAAVDHAAGHRGAARHAVEVLEQTASQGTAGVYAAIGPGIADLLTELQPHVRGRRRLRIHLDAVMRELYRSRPAGAGWAVELTSRELELLPYLPTRLSNAEIAAELFISINTVKTHMKHIYAKLGAEGRDDAIRLARQHHLL